MNESGAVLFYEGEFFLLELLQIVKSQHIGIYTILFFNSWLFPYGLQSSMADRRLGNALKRVKINFGISHRVPLLDALSNGILSPSDVVLHLLVLLNAQNALVVASFFPLLKDFTFGPQQLDLDHLLIVVFDGFLDHGHDLLVVREDLRPVAFPDRVTCAIGVRPVFEEGPNVESCTVGADDVAVLVAEAVVGNAIDVEANLVGAFVEEEHLGESFELVDQHDVLLFAAGLQGAEDVEHEVLIVLILPVVEGGLVLRLLVRYAKETAEAFEEVAVEEDSIYIYLDILWELLEDLLVLRVLKCIVFVFIPSVSKVGLDSPLKVQIDRFEIVELLKKIEKGGELVPFVDVGVILLELIEYLAKGTHNDGEDGNSKKKDEGSEESLKVTSWVVVSESHS